MFCSFVRSLTDYGYTYYDQKVWSEFKVVDTIIPVVIARDS